MKNKIKNKLTKEWKPTNYFADVPGQFYRVHKILQDLLDEGFAEKQKIGRITYWRKK